jgi:hypothetical protein
MASDYGLNFGFLRSGEEVRVAEGRYKTPVGSALLLGTMVEVDPASDGYLKVSAANATFVTGFRGLLLQELEWDRSIYESPADMLDSFQMGVAKADRLSLITSGAGTKVWLRNTTTTTRADGRVTPTRTMLTTLTGLAVGDEIGWDGTSWAEAATGKAMRVTAVDTTKSLVEAVLLG